MVKQPLPNLFLAISLLLSATLTAQPTGQSFEQIDSLQQMEARPLLVFIHTDWCRYCQAMENSTLKNKEVVQALNDRFYFVRLDGEEKREIPFRKNIFRFQPTGHQTGVHELARALGTIDGQLNFPTLCLLNSAYEIIFQHSGFLSAGEMLRILKQTSP